MQQVSERTATTPLDATDRRIIEALQEGFPVCERPYAAAARRLDLTETELIERLRRLLKRGALTRFGPLYNADRMGGANVLAAMAVPEPDFERVSQIVNRQTEVAHNYRREHRLNMWFVVAADTPQKVDATLRRIEAESGLPVHRFPKEREYFVTLRLKA
ncbi:MAG: Lrp/AsnC family transcriptional regulator [Thiobacillaceae bacterium]